MSRMRFYSAESNLGTHLTGTLLNQSSLTIMFCVHTLCDAHSISDLFDSQPTDFQYEIAHFSSIVEVVGQPDLGDHLLCSLVHV